MDVASAKPHPMELYAGNASLDHSFPLHIWMWLVPKINSVLNTQGCCKINKLRACQVTWTTTKLILLKTWEIKFLNKCNIVMEVSLRDAIMAIKHPANPCFLLFHSINHHWKDDCYVITCLKSADSLAQAMIAVLLPYIKWTLEARYHKVVMAQVPKWFKPAAPADALWDPKEECIWNKSDEMLNQAISHADGLYWELDAVDPTPVKHKKNKVDEIKSLLIVLSD